MSFKNDYMSQVRYIMYLPMILESSEHFLYKICKLKLK